MTEFCDRCLARPSDDWPAPEGGALCQACRDAELDALDDTVSGDLFDTGGHIPLARRLNLFSGERGLHGWDRRNERQW